MKGARHGQCSGARRRSAVVAVMGMASLWLSAPVMATTPLETNEDLVGLCDLSEVDPSEEGDEDINAYHEQRRQAVHQLYETPLQDLDEAVLDFDRVTGVMTISGFRRYQPRIGAPGIRFRNECILSFEFDEERAHDVVTRMRLGTVQLRIGFMVAAHDDYEVAYCVAGDEEGGSEELVVDLLYARLIDLEQDEKDAVIGTYQTRFGHERALRQSTLLVDAAQRSVPEVEVSHFQWRLRGQSWRAEVSGGDTPESLDEVQQNLQSDLERALYPCYVRALSRNASLQGALVMEIPYGELSQNAQQEPRFLMDTLDDEVLRNCIAERVEALDTVERGLLPEVDAFKATVLLRRR